MKADVLVAAISQHRYLSDIAADYISQRKRLRKLKEGIQIKEIKFFCYSSEEETFTFNSHHGIDATPFLEAIDNEIEYIKEEIRDIEREFPMIEFETILEE